jgi:hypothetical protein
MSIPKNLAITFNKEALDELVGTTEAAEAAEAQVRELEQHLRIEAAAAEIYEPGTSPSHAGDQFVRQTNLGENDVAVQSTIRTGRGHQNK